MSQYKRNKDGQFYRTGKKVPAIKVIKTKKVPAIKVK